MRYFEGRCQTDWCSVFVHFNGWSGESVNELNGLDPPLNPFFHLFYPLTSCAHKISVRRVRPDLR